VNDGDFQHRIARAEVTFVTDKEDGAEQAHQARRLAIELISESLRRQSDSPVAEVDPTPAATVEEAVPPVENDAGFPASVDLSQPAAPLPVSKKGRKSAQNPTPSIPPSDEPSNSSPGEEKPIPTDEMLRSACGARQERGLANGETNVGVWIRELIAKYVGSPGKKAADIPQDQRPAFIRELLA
jgi:hypothetical protein